MSIKSKLENMSADQACKWVLDHYTGTGEMIVVRFDGAKLESQIFVNGQPTRYRVASFKCVPFTAVCKLANEWGVDKVFIIGQYGDVTSVVKYVR